MTVNEAYQEFKKSHPDLNIGKSSFHSLRPEHVMLIKDTPHNVCVCRTHFNFINIVESIANVCDSVPKNHNELLSIICCDTTQEDCMFGVCKNCSKIDKLIKPEMDLQVKIKYKQWAPLVG